MTLNEYQQQAMTTCTPSCDNAAYMLLNLQGEVGEFSGKVAKAIRKKQMDFLGNETTSTNHLTYRPDISDPDTIALIDHGLMLEAGDILWQLSGLCQVFGWTLEDVARANLEKLAHRQAEGTIIGDGDYR